MKISTGVKKMYVLDGGNFLFETGMMMMGKDPGKQQRILVPYFLFDTEEGWVLFDTGWPAEVIPMLEQMGVEADITQENMAAAQLERLGVAPKDIAKVILSHMHTDHAGGLGQFEQAKVYVQKDELAFAQYPNTFMELAYGKDLLPIPPMDWELLQGDTPIMPGITAILASGHTPGLQGLVVELPKTGYVILTSDSVYLEENLETVQPPALACDTRQAQYAIARFKTFETLLDARVFPGHDYEFYTKKVDMTRPYE